MYLLTFAVWSFSPILVHVVQVVQVSMSVSGLCLVSDRREGGWYRPALLGLSGAVGADKAPQSRFQLIEQ